MNANLDRPTSGGDLQLASRPQDERFAAVTAYVDAGYQSLGLPGASLLVWQRGQYIYERYFGAYEPSTVVAIASASKWLSGAVLMTLVDDGLIDLDARISQYMPMFTGDKGEMTIRQMFSLTSGLIEAPGQARQWRNDITMQAYAERQAREGIMAAKPGTEVRYSGASMQVVGAVAEQVTGKPWNDLFLERIAGPCEMRSSSYTARLFPDWSDLRPLNPMLAGGAVSSLGDYGRFLEMIAGKGRYGGRQVISAASVAEMESDQTRSLPLVTASQDRMKHGGHYAIGHWVDVWDESGRPRQVSSPGAFGFRPWLNLDRDLFAVFMIRREGDARAVNDTFNHWNLIDLVHAAADAAA